MAEETKRPLSDDAVEPTVLEEPGSEQDSPELAEGDEQNVWMRGLWMLLLAVLFGIGELILVVAAVLQFLWLLFGKEKNQPIADFGADLADWLARIARFQTCTTEEKPFPFVKWGRED